MKKNIALPIILLIIFSGTCFSQVTTGTVVGRLVSPDGSPVSEANVVLSGSASLNNIGTSTDTRGRFYFHNIAIGKYTLRITHVSYKISEVHDIDVNLGSETNLGTIKMEAGQTELGEVVIISNSQVLSRSGEISQSLQKETMDFLPVDRDYKNAITLLPQINTSYYGDGLNVNGSTGGENMFYLDGINVTDNFSSQISPTFNNSSFVPYNFIKEVKIKESGYSAEFGRALGGIVDVVTKSGSNHFQGQVFGYYSGSFLNGVPSSGATGAAIKKTSNYDAGFNFGGPLIKDKLWYFVAYSSYKTQHDTEIKGHGFFPDQTISQLFAAKLNWRISSNTNLDFTLIGDPTTSTPIANAVGNSQVVPDSIANSDILRAKTKNGGVNISLKGASQISDRTIIDFSISAYNRSSDLSGATEKGESEPSFIDINTSIASGGYGYRENFDITKQSAKFSLTHTENLHTFKVGGEFEFNSTTGTLAITDPGYIYQYAPDYYFVFDFKSNLDLHSRYAAAFYQHDWQVSKSLSVTVGIRWEMQRLYDKSTVLQSFDNQWQPRLGINWFLNKEETKKLSIHYCRVYQFIPLNFCYYYSPANEALITLYDTDPRSSGASPTDTLDQLIPYTTQRFQYNKYIFNANYADQISMQYQQQLGKGLTFTSRVLFKSLRDAFMLGVDSTNTEYSGNPGKGQMIFLPKVKQEYAALELGLTKSKGNFTYGFYYVLSRNYGNITGFYNQENRNYNPGGQASFGAQTTVDSLKANTTGLMPNNRTHVLKLNAFYRFKNGFSMGTFLNISNGTRLNQYIQNKISGWDLLSKRGTAGHLPTILDLNFRLTYKPQKFPARFSMDIFHVGTPQKVVDQVQLKTLHRYDESQNDVYSPNPTYGQPVRFQPPMAVRFGFEYNF